MVLHLATTDAAFVVARVRTEVQQTLMNMSARAAAAGCPIARFRPTSSARARQRVAACSASRHQDSRSAWPMTNQRPARYCFCIYRLPDGESTHLIDAHGTRNASQVPKGG